MENPPSESPEKRALMGLLVPLGVLSFMALVIGSIGVLLLFLAGLQHEYLGVKEPLSVLVALLLAGGILGGAALLARRRSGT